MKFFTQFELKKDLSECRKMQFHINARDKYRKSNELEIKIGKIMNDFDVFMGLIEETYIPIEKAKKIIVERFFTKFLHNLAHKALKDRKHFIAREHLTDLDENFMNQPFDLDL